MPLKKNINIREPFSDIPYVIMLVTDKHSAE